MTTLYADDDLRCFVLRNVRVKDRLHDVVPIGPCQFDAAFQSIFGGAAYEPRIHSSSEKEQNTTFIGDFTITLFYHSSTSYSTIKTMNMNRKKRNVSTQGKHFNKLRAAGYVAHNSRMI